jgi:hypothetical protein
MKKTYFVFLTLSLMFFMACTHSVTMRPNLDVTATIANQLGFNVGLYIPPEVKQLKVSDQANWANKYSFDVGQSVSSIIYRALSRVFKYVELTESYPTEQMIKERSFDFVATARITEANVGLNIQEGFWSNDAAGNTQITASLAFFDQGLIQFTSVQATGTGMADERIDMLSSGKNEFSTSVENAIRNLGNNIVQQVYGNYDIRKRAEINK